MTENKLLPIAEIARLLNLPESTLHYWKNRFSEYLPSIGDGRQKRFRAETVDIFRAIAEMLQLGLSTKDVKAELARLYPLNVDPGQEQPRVPVLATSMEAQAQIVSQVGMEIAKAIGETLRSMLTPLQPQPALTAADPEALRAVDGRLDEAGERLQTQAEEITSLRRENDDLKLRLQTMEAELVRLRKDRREMEKYLVEKINALKKS